MKTSRYAISGCYMTPKSVAEKMRVILKKAAKMVTSCKTARSRYVIALEEVNKSRRNEAANNKRKIIAEEIDSVKRKRM